ncbi:hypothetical protein [Cyclobacterium qasimii]|uniref:Lipoprotein n=2 Tax=Cyclobacterium qasimii TaxID=1350429 RepID=S7VBW2_9BACT|nr:hypothetical protein [Cyclobacterium qasimii]EPR67062.1 hypothetical protein ADICYQ_3932 [Cyclobacterium qasimii M12-11B]GEO19724.1 hypothetical protein CQA01_02580 [Cyclobacterium qasimii]
MTLSKSIFTAIAIFSLISCTKEEDMEIKNEVSEEEVIVVIESSLQKSTGGLNEMTNTFSKELTTNITLNELCGNLYENSYNYNYNETPILADYDIDWSYMMACNSFNVPQMVAFEANSVGSYSTSRINSNDISIIDIDISGLQPSASTLLFSGIFNREGTQSITTNLKTRSLTSTFNVDLVDVVIDKSNYIISSGSGTFILSGLSQNIPFSFNGTIVFNGNGSVTLTVNENDYEININE